VIVDRHHGDRVAEELRCDGLDDLRLEESVPCLDDDNDLAEQTQEEFLDRQEFCEARGLWRQSSVSMQNLRTIFVSCWAKYGSFRANFAKLWQKNSVRHVTTGCSVIIEHQNVGKREES
jgi:hypothetical protein